MPTKPVQKSRYDTRRDIIALSNHGLPVRQIVKETGASESTVYRAVAKYKKEGHVHDLPRSGRPPTLSKADKQILADVVEEHPTYALRDITKASGLNVSHPTVDKALKEAGYTLHIKHKKPYLKPHHKQARLDWCRRRQRSDQNYWRRMVWTDEIHLEYSPNPRGQKVRYLPGQGMEERYLEPSFASGRTKIHLWGCFQYGSKGPLVWIKRRPPSQRLKKRDAGGMNGKQYAEEIVQDSLFPYITIMGREGSKTVEDNTKVHDSEPAKGTRDLLGINRMPWPACSPDLNCIENVWHLLKTALRRRFSLIEKRPHSPTELFEAAQEEWDKISQDKLNSLVDSMNRRVMAVIEANGAATKY